MSEHFHVELLSNGDIFVIILSTEMTSVYWKELKNVISELRRSNVKVYFDFLYRNGFQNRFFAAMVNNDSLLEGKLRRCDMSEYYKRITNLFFRFHIDLLYGSALSKEHRNQFVRVLQSL